MSEVLHPEEQITTIVYVRHGETAQTQAGLLYNDPQAALTEKGRKQALAVAEWTGGVERPDVLLSSRAQRVRDTAEILSDAVGIPLNIIDKLDEVNPGLWEGRSYLEVKKSDPEQYHAWCADPIRNAPPEGESIVQLAQRVQGELAQILANWHGKKILLVSHAGVIRSALVLALGMPIDNFWRIAVPTGSVSKVDYTSNFATVQYMSLRV